MAQTAMVNSGVLYTDRRDFYLNPKQTAELWPSVTPFLTLSSKMKVMQSPDPDYRMFQHAASWMNAYCLHNNGSPTALAAEGSANTYTFDGPTGMYPTVGDVYDVWTSDRATYNGQCVVTAVSRTSATEGTFTATTTKLSNATTTDNGFFFLIGSAVEEGTGSPAAWSEELAMVYNSAQIFKTPLEITGTLLANAKLRGASSELARLRMQKSKEHEMKKELALLLGRKDGGITAVGTHRTGTTNQIRTTHGLIPTITDYDAGNGTNVHSFSKASLKYAQFVELMKSAYKYGNDNATKVAICGDDFLAWVASFATTTGMEKNLNLTMAQDSKSFGWQFRSLQHQFGKLDLVRSPLLTNHANGLYSGYCLIIDPENVSMVRYRPDQFQAAIQAPDIDGIKDQYFSDCGLGVTLPQTHHILIAK